MNKKTIAAIVGLTLAAGPASALDYDFMDHFEYMQSQSTLTLQIPWTLIPTGVMPIPGWGSISAGLWQRWLQQCLCKA